MRAALLARRRVCFARVWEQHPPAADVVVRARRPCPLSLPAGYSVRAIVRSKDRAKELLPAEIELKVGDTCDPAFGDGSPPVPRL